ncbi:MAG: hypothetical protein KDH88_00405 [Chromatiales bacterium]|nr:hypothetical protein [Chromatiales bacterium]
MLDPRPIYEQLRSLCGKRVRYLGEDLIVVDLLDEPYALVLQADGDPAIQADLHGNPCRRAPRTLTVPLLDASGEKLNPDLAEIGVPIKTS